MELNPDDGPRSMRHPKVRQQRREMLSLPHMVPLKAYVDGLRALSKGEVQDLDPLDGGVNAKILFLLEKPGPMTDVSKTSLRAGSVGYSRGYPPKLKLELLSKWSDHVEGLIRPEGETLLR